MPAKFGKILLLIEQNMEDKELEKMNAILVKIAVCLKCNRKVQEDHAFCLENELPISMITSNVSISCPLGKF